MIRTAPRRRDPRRGGSATACGHESVIREAGVRRRHRLQRDFAGAERERRNARQLADAHRLRVLRRCAGCRPAAGGARRRGCSTCAARCAASWTSALECSSSGVHAPCGVSIGSLRFSSSDAGRVAGLERRRVDERLERGSGLALRLDRAVEVAFVEVAAADHRADVRRSADPCATSAACSGVASSARSLALPRAALRASIAFSDAATADSAATCMRHVDRRIDAQAALIDALPSEAIDQLAAHLLLEVLAVRLLRAQVVGERHRFRRAPASHVGRSMTPLSSIACSTTLRRARARGRLTVGA